MLETATYKMLEGAVKYTKAEMQVKPTCSNSPIQNVFMNPYELNWNHYGTAVLNTQISHGNSKNVKGLWKVMSKYMTFMYALVDAKPFSFNLDMYPGT